MMMMMMLVLNASGNDASRPKDDTEDKTLMFYELNASASDALPVPESRESRMQTSALILARE